jgi:hypothetical protein
MASLSEEGGDKNEGPWSDVVGEPIRPPMGVEKSGRDVSVPPVHTLSVSIAVHA